MSRTELAFRAKVDYGTIVRIEIGKHLPNPRTAKALARVLKCSFAAIYGEDPEAEAI